jgi:hypothetical protein
MTRANLFGQGAFAPSARKDSHDLPVFDLNQRSVRRDCNLFGSFPRAPKGG